MSFQTIAEQDTDVEFKEKVSKLTEEMMEREGAVATEMEICETELGARNIIGNVSSEARETTEEVAIIAANLEQKFESEVEIIEADSQNAIEDDVEINEVQQKVAVEIEIEEETDEKVFLICVLYSIIFSLMVVIFISRTTACSCLLGIIGLSNSATLLV